MQKDTLKKQMQQNQQQTILQIKDAVEHIDRSMADKFLRAMKKGEINSPEALRYKVALQIVDFPNLADDDAVNVMQKNILDFFRLGISLKDSLENRYSIQGSYSKNKQRKLLLQAIMKNEERLGKLYLLEWIKEFSKLSNEDRQGENIILRFLLNFKEAENLSNIEKNVLKNILYVYDELLSDDLLDIFDLVDAKERLKQGKIRLMQRPVGAFANPEERGERYIETQRTYSTSSLAGSQNKESKNIVSMSFPEALKKFPNIGEQPITSMPIKLQYFPDRVKPSVKNWIADYRGKLGNGKHSSVERGDFLFHSENGKPLSPLERMRVAQILKSLDENLEVEIDSGTQQIIFSNKSDQETVPAGDKSTMNKFSQSEQGNEKSKAIFSYAQEKYEIPKLDSNKTGFSKPAWNPAQSVKQRMSIDDDIAEKKSLSFSSPHKFPVENQRQDYLQSQERKISNSFSNQESISEKESPDDIFDLAVKRKQVFSEPKIQLPKTQVVNSQPVEFSNQKKQNHDLSKSKVLYRITPRGFQYSDKKENDNSNAGPKVSGNVVDLKQ